MCLTTKQKEPLIAEKDIICYKFLEKTRHEHCSPFYPFLWTKDELYTSEIVIRKSIENDYEKEIDDGFHAYISKKSLYNVSNFHFQSNVPVKMKIPKGSKYYISECGDEIVSDQMILLGELNWMSKFLISKYGTF